MAVTTTDSRRVGRALSSRFFFFILLLTVDYKFTLRNTPKRYDNASYDQENPLTGVA